MLMSTASFPASFGGRSAPSPSAVPFAASWHPIVAATRSHPPAGKQGASMMRDADGVCLEPVAVPPANPVLLLPLAQRRPWPAGGGEARGHCAESHGHVSPEYGAADSVASSLPPTVVQVPSARFPAEVIALGEMPSSDQWHISLRDGDLSPGTPRRSLVYTSTTSSGMLTITSVATPLRTPVSVMSPSRMHSPTKGWSFVVRSPRAADASQRSPTRQQRLSAGTVSLCTLNGLAAGQVVDWHMLYLREVGRHPVSADQFRAFVLNRGGHLPYCVARRVVTPLTRSMSMRELTTTDR